jgi:mono/diheme cytochrome c family protein
MTHFSLNAAGKLSCLLGALALVCLAAAPQPQAEQVAQESGPPDGGDDRLRSLDPWNVQIRDRPQWDPRNAPPQLQNRAKRHLEFLQGGVPVEYRSQRSPYPNVPKAITAGGEVYRANCIACHGAKGRGDGDAGLDLLPSPALLSEMMDKQGTVDEYLLWTISEGGQAFDTSMPAYKDRLTENQIWQVIAYLRAGFPPQN